MLWTVVHSRGALATSGGPRDHQSVSAPTGPPTGSSPPPPPAGRRRPRPGQVAGAALLVLALVFVFENTKNVKVRLIAPEVRAPLFVALLIAALCGAATVLLLQWRGRRSR